MDGALVLALSSDRGANCKAYLVLSMLYSQIKGEISFNVSVLHHGGGMLMLQPCHAVRAKC